MLPTMTDFSGNSSGVSLLTRFDTLIESSVSISFNAKWYIAFDSSPNLV